MKRSIYLGAALVLALVAAGLTLRAQHTVGVVVATHDLRAGAHLTATDVQLQRMHEDSVPGGALSSTDGLAGEFVAWPLTAGEPVLGRALSRGPAGASVVSGFTVPAGYRAIAMPVSPAGAVGGMLVPGEHVDVYATPNAQHAADQSGDSVTSTDVTGDVSDSTVLGQDLLVLQLRSDQGQSLDTSQPTDDSSVHGLNFGSTKLGSVVLAVPQADVTQYAAAAADDTIFLALTVT